MGEARLAPRDEGLTAVTDGWFVVNVRDAPWVTNETLGAACIFEGDEAPFPHVGYTLVVMQPGQFSMYHREANQENFLVLAGECVLLVEGEERRLRAWDFVHCPPHTEHGFAAVGDSPCLIFATGARKGWPETGVFFPRSELALRYGNGVETATSLRAEAYASLPKWKPGPPPSWAGMPWG